MPPAKREAFLFNYLWVAPVVVVVVVVVCRIYFHKKICRHSISLQKFFL